MRRLMLLAALAGIPSLSAGDWRPQIQERGEALHGLTFSPDGQWALTSGGDSWASRYSTQVTLRLWSVHAQACVWKRVLIPGEAAGQIMATPVGILDDRSCLVQWTEFGDNSNQSMRGSWLGRISKSGEWLWKVKAPSGQGFISNDQSYVGFQDSTRGGDLDCILLADQSLAKRPASDFPALADSASDDHRLRLRTEKLSDRSVLLVASENGNDRWRRELTTNADILRPQEVPIEGDRTGRWIGWSDGRTLVVLDAQTGDIRFRSDTIEGEPSLVSPGNSAAEVWLFTAPRKDASEENPSESMLARLSLDGSSLMTPVPLEGTFCWSEKEIIVDNRYLVSANFSGPQAIWCWDMKTLTLLWFHEGSDMIWTEGGLFSDNGVVYVAWDQPGPIEAFRLKDGHPVASDWPGDHGSFGEKAIDPATLQRLRRKQLSFREVGGRVSVTLPGGRSGLLSPGAISQDLEWAALALSDEGINQTAVVNLSTGYSVRLLVQRNGSRPPEWLAVDEAGRFEGSSGSGRLVAMCRELQVYPIDQFAASLNRPDHILSRLGSSDNATVEEMRNRLEARRGSLPPSPAATNQPEVLIRSVEQQNGIARLSCTIGTSADTPAVLQVYVNEVPLFGRDGQSFAQPGLITLEIPLSPANNKIEVEYLGPDGLTSPRAVHHLVNRGPHAGGKIHFLGVGCSLYAHQAIPDLAFAHSDAIDMHGAFAQMDNDNASQLSPGTLVNEEATRSRIIAALETLTSAQIEDTVVVFFAGHGCQDEGSYFFLSHDADPTSLADTAVSFTEIEDALFRCRARKKLLFLDTCASGQFPSDLATSPANSAVPARQFTARSLSGKLSRKSNTAIEGGLGRRFSDNDLFRRSGTVVVSSCAADEVSLESPRWKNGAFTEAVLETLRSPAADRDGDGRLQKNELLLSCRTRVDELVRQLGDEDIRQTPALDRDNLWEQISLPIAGNEGGKAASFVLAEGSLPESSHEWIGRLDSTGQAQGYGTLRAASGTTYSGRMIGGRFEGLVTKRMRSDAASVSHWQQGKRVSDWKRTEGEIVPKPPVQTVIPPTPNRGTITMARVGVAGYMATTNGVLVWNNFPAATDVAHWEGAVDPNGFATGRGILRWFKGDRFTTGYLGTMVNGKLEGESISQDADGSTSRVWWKDGKKVRR